MKHRPLLLMLGHLWLVMLFITNPLFATEQRGLTITTEWGRLEGTLYTPDKECDTAIIIIAGSGPTDRYGNSPAGINTQSYALLADALCREGYAVLSYDKRGIAASYYNNREEMLTDCHFNYYVDDAALWAEQLKELGYKSIVLAGHSEGALIALIAANREGCNIDGVISLSGAAYPIDQILKQQLLAQLITYDYSLYVEAGRIIDTIKRGERPAQVPEMLKSLFAEYLYDFLYEQMSYDPRQLARTLPTPLLIVGGGKDLQLSVDNAHELKRANPNAQMVIIEEMTHTLKSSQGATIQAQMTAYRDPSLPLSNGLTEAIVEFLKSLKE